MPDDGPASLEEETETETTGTAEDAASRTADKDGAVVGWGFGGGVMLGLASIQWSAEWRTYPLLLPWREPSFRVDYYYPILMYLCCAVRYVRRS